MRSVRTARGWPCWCSAAAVLFCLLITSGPLPAQDLSAKVEQILSTPQRYSGSMIIDLVQLGSPAVPALTKNLYTYPFPLVILRALRRIGDPSASGPVLAYLNNISADRDRQEEQLMALALLRELGDMGAETSLDLLMSDEQTPLSTRLAAASALARWGSPPVREQAATLIIKTAREWRPGIGRDEILDEALAAVGTAKSQAVLMARLQSVRRTAEQGQIIRLLAQQPTTELAAPLLAFAERRDRDAHVRLYAVQKLVNSGLEFPRERILLVLEQLRTVLPAELRSQADEVQSRVAR